MSNATTNTTAPTHAPIDPTAPIEDGPVTLDQLFVTLAVGCVVLPVVLLLFAGALRLRITHVAPRCEARPRNVIYNPDPNCDASQKRGSPFALGWLFWALSLSYHTMMEGVPGTGTRNDGLSGHLLKVNLDNIVLLRFHAMALRISLFAMVIFCCICMPMYRTARCYEDPFSDANQTQVNQNCTELYYNLTAYEKLTLSNVPDVEAWDDDAPFVSFRLYVVVMCTYLVCWYTSHELHKEWIDLLAMRRVYYLEYDHWEARREELKATMLNHAESSHGKEDDDNPHLHQREAWIPHPEQRDTPPSIELYSVLVGGLPKRPQQAVSEEDLEKALSDGDGGIDWQLSVTSAFFDYCVPNQPGFSSSVAAVTILPSASELAAAWKKWYGATKKLERLRYIRRTLCERGYQEEHELIHNEDVVEASLKKIAEGGNEVYLRSSSTRARYMNEVLGAVTDEDVEAMFLKSLQMGPEQTAVYSRELAMGSSKCCPHGCCEQQIWWSNTQKLLEMEEEAAEDARDSFFDLELARKKVAEHDPSEDFTKPRPSKFWLDKSPQPAVYWFDKSEAVDSKNPESLESKLFTKGHSDLEVASQHRKKPKEKTRSKHLNGQAGDQQSRGMETNSSSVSGNSAQGDQRASNNNGTVRLRPRLETESSTYFPSLLKMSVDHQPDSVKDRKEVSFRPTTDAARNRWELVNCVAHESEVGHSETGDNVSHHTVSDGVWRFPSPSHLWNEFWRRTCSLFVWTAKTSDLATDLMARDSTYAVVTFTSRQAAIAARKCLADGRGASRWMTIDDLPVAPLADASAFNICDCRGCCRPVTVTLNDHQKIWRHYAALIAVVVVYVGYTYPITQAATFGSEYVPEFEITPTHHLSSDQTFGFIRAMLLNLFLAFCPHMFLAIANFGSNATSMVGAEFAALQYYWWFFLLFALIGSSILQMVLKSFTEGTFDWKGTLREVASTIPSQVSSNWTNWVILKAMVFHPLFYLLQIQTFLLAAFNLKCCVRLVRGGGVGNRVPYRWYVESGMVLMFVLALAPAAPIVAPFAVLYFIICNPILRHILIFTYKPQFDGGGNRWPFMFEMVISSMLASQLLMGVMLVLKKAIVPAIFAILLMIPTLVFRRTCKKRFQGAYQDAALLQTSLLDGWDTNENTSTKTVEGREEFRQFLVDSHKAAYVPGTNTDKILTAEPAVVVPAITDDDYREFSNSELAPPPVVITQVPATQSGTKSVPQEHFYSMSSQQFGAVMRRTFTTELPVQAEGPCAPSSREHLNAETEDSPNIKLSSLGFIREGLDGEIIVEINESEKDK